MKRKPNRHHVTQPHLKIIRTLWKNSPIKTSYVVVDLNAGQEYPQNFVCVFPKNLFRRNQKANLRRTKFFRVFDEKSHEMAGNLLEDALKRETDSKIKAEIEALLEEIMESGASRKHTND
jgi:hypothetical protein